MKKFMQWMSDVFAPKMNRAARRGISQFPILQRLCKFLIQPDFAFPGFFDPVFHYGKEASSPDAQTGWLGWAGPLHHDHRSADRRRHFQRQL